MTPSRINLEIGGFNIALVSPLPLVMPDSDSYYSSFVRPSVTPVDADVLIEIRTGEMSDIKGLSLLFDSGDSWAIYTDGADYFFSSSNLAIEQPLWLFRFNKDLNRGILYCGGGIAEEAKATGRIRNLFSYPLDQLVLTHILAHNNGTIIHAAGIEFDGRAYIFPGKSGAGKSTISRQFEGRDDIFRINDDRMILRKTGEIYMAYGTPWPGEANIAENSTAPLAGIFFIKHSPANEIVKISPADALQSLMPVVSIPWYDRQTSDMILSFCDDLLSEIPLYEIGFKPGPELADFFIDTAGKGN
jgi:hypothetical protein